MLYCVIAVAVTLVISVPVTFVVTSAYRKKETETKIGNAEEKAREIMFEHLQNGINRLADQKGESQPGENDMRR